MAVKESLSQAVTEDTGRMIPLEDFDDSLSTVYFKSAEWYRANYGDACRACTESRTSRQFLGTMLGELVRLQRSGADFSVPLILVAATMLQTGYTIGRQLAEAEVLEGWMKL
jgi:hypothetical protein